MDEFTGPALLLNKDLDIPIAARALSCDEATVYAVLEVEASGSGFFPDRRPTILYEAHVFYRLTNGRFGNTNISSPHWNRSLYGAQGAYQYGRLKRALVLDRSAALQSASWGLFQILGENYKVAGYSSIESFVRAMVFSERKHLDAFVTFCLVNRLNLYLHNRDWAEFSYRYNGPGYATNSYDTKLAAAYEKHKKILLLKADSKIYAKSLQAALNLYNFEPLVIDGDIGSKTKNYIRAVQAVNNLPMTGSADAVTLAILGLGLQ